MHGLIWGTVLGFALSYVAYGAYDLWSNRVRPQPQKPMSVVPDRRRHDEMLDLAVERLTALGTERGERLAMEIQRGRLREDKREQNDEAVLRALGGAHFGPDARVTLPSGRTLGSNEAQALTNFYGPSTDDGWQRTGRTGRPRKQHTEEET
jgi:hypothetical protein